jgi:hypothetical protein
MSRMRFAGVPFLLFEAAWLGVMGLLVLLLWNQLASPIFHLREISFLEGIGLLILCRVLFGGFRGWGSGMRKARWVRGWKDLTDEERERFRKAVAADCQNGPAEG